jgi:hypothetical protein
MTVICPACKQELSAKKPAFLLRALADDSGGMFLVKAFICQCGSIFSPSTKDGQGEWQSRYNAQKQNGFGIPLDTD